MTKYSDPFAFKPRHQVAFFGSLALIAACIVLYIFSVIPPAVTAIAVVCAAICMINARFPEILWEIEKAFMRFKVEGDIEPSDWWYVNREILIFGILGVGVFTLLYGLLS